MSLLPNWAQKRLQPVKPADVIVYKDGDYAVAVDSKTGQVIVRNMDHAYVIQEAINHLSSGGKIYIDTGNYEIGKTIILSSNISIVGSGNSTILNLSVDTNMFENPDSSDINNISIENMVLDGQGRNYNAISIGYGVNKSMLKFKHLEIRNFNTGIWLNGNPPPSNVIIEDIYIHDCTKYGIASYYYEDVIIRDVMIENIGQEAIHMTGNNSVSPAYVSKRIRVENVVIKNPGNIGIDISYVENPIITKFYIEGAIAKGINGEPLSDSSHNDLPYGDQAIIENGIIINCPGAGIYITYGFRTKIRNVFIYNVGYNYSGTTDNRRHGILFLVEEGAIENVVVWKAAGTGIVMNPLTKYSGIYNPVVYECGEHGIFMNDVQNVIIINPLVYNNSQLTTNTYDGIHIEGSLSTHYITIIGGRIIDTQTTKTQRYGIYETSTASPYYGDNRFISVTIFPQATDRIYWTGKYTKIIECPGVLTNNSGQYVTSGDGTTTQFSIPHGLVSTPSRVLVTPCSLDAAGTMYVTVDSTNIYVNYSTAPPTGTNNVCLYWWAEV